METMTALLAELRELLDRSTPGPWSITGPSKGGTPADDGGDYAILAGGQIIAEAIYRVDKLEYRPARDNARLIVAMHNSLAALLDRVEGQRELLEKARKIIDDQAQVLFECTTDSEGNWSTDPIDAETQVKYDAMLLLTQQIDDALKET